MRVTVLLLPQCCPRWRCCTYREIETPIAQIQRLAVRQADVWPWCTTVILKVSLQVWRRALPGNLTRLSCHKAGLHTRPACRPDVLGLPGVGGPPPSMEYVSWGPCPMVFRIFVFYFLPAAGGKGSLCFPPILSVMGYSVLSMEYVLEPIHNGV